MEIIIILSSYSEGTLDLPLGAFRARSRVPPAVLKIKYKIILLPVLGCAT